MFQYFNIFQLYFNYISIYSLFDLSRNGGQWLAGKAMDSFCPIGPAIVTRSYHLHHGDALHNEHNCPQLSKILLISPAIGTRSYHRHHFHYGDALHNDHCPQFPIVRNMTIHVVMTISHIVILNWPAIATRSYYHRHHFHYGDALHNDYCPQ